MQISLNGLTAKTLNPRHWYKHFYAGKNQIDSNGVLHLSKASFGDLIELDLSISLDYNRWQCNNRGECSLAYQAELKTPQKDMDQYVYYQLRKE